MGKKSKKKRGTLGAPQPAAPEPPPAARRPPGRLLIVAGIAIAAAVWFVSQRDAPLDVDVPDPDTSAMMRPVAERITEARTAVLNRPESSDTWGRLGAVFDAHHLYDEAVACYEHALTLAPGDFRFVYSLAVVSDLQGSEPEEIVGLFDQVITLQPSYPPAHHRYGDALSRLGRIAEARDAYAKAVDLDPNFAMARRALGLMQLDLDEVQAGLANLERSAELEPSDAVTFNGLARAYRLAGDDAAAQEAADAAAQKQPIYGVPDPVRFEVDDLAINPQACNRRAREYTSQGRHREALGELLLLAEMTPGEASVRHRLGVTYLRLGEVDRAVSLLREAAELDPERLDTRIQLGAIYEDLGQLDDAITCFREAVALRDQDPALHKRLALLQGKSGRMDDAIESFRSALVVGPPDPEVHHNLGTALDRRGDREEACEQFEAALRLDPQNPHTHFNLGLSLQALGRDDQAIDHYRAAVAVDPNHAAAAYLRELTGG